MQEIKLHFSQIQLTLTIEDYKYDLILKINFAYA